MKPIKTIAFSMGLVALLSGSGTAQAVSSFTADYPSSSSTIVASTGFLDDDEIGYFWSVSRGDSITQTFTGTGLNSVDQIDLSLEVTQNVLTNGAHVDWAVLINSIQVGTWTWTDQDGTGAFNLSYLFSPIVGAGTYTVRMEVTNEVASGDGSIALRYPGTMTLVQNVPEPTSLLLLGSGLLLGCVLKFAPRRRARAHRDC